MNIEIKREPGKLTLKLQGRLETATTPQLEAELGDHLIGIKMLLLDFSKLEYITSAGLRVLLSTHKKMKAQEGSMVIRGANEEVSEVFRITGFSNILTFE